MGCVWWVWLELLVFVWFGWICLGGVVVECVWWVWLGWSVFVLFGGSLGCVCVLGPNWCRKGVSLGVGLCIVSLLVVLCFLLVLSGMGCVFVVELLEELFWMCCVAFSCV